MKIRETLEKKKILKKRVLVIPHVPGEKVIRVREMQLALSLRPWMEVRLSLHHKSIP